jgi:hypothetical protein
MSDGVRRWSFTPHGMGESKDGKWVEIEDHERLRAENERLVDTLHFVTGVSRPASEWIKYGTKELKRGESVSGEYAIIPADKIDAMWKYIEKLKIAGDDYCSSLAITIKEVLALAGIVECEECLECGIFGTIGNTDPNTGEDLGPCPACHGHGWVIKRDFTPLDPETADHDMKRGPCKCGAWHDGEVSND